jgi:cell shape-determining protein MreC
LGFEIAIALAILSTRSQFKEMEKRLEYEQQVAKERERQKTRIQYLDPLVVSAGDLLSKVNKLREELRTKSDYWKNTFSEVKTRDRNKREDFAFWCNGYGAGAVTTLYVTIVYFAHTSKIRYHPACGSAPGGS